MRLFFLTAAAASLVWDGGVGGGGGKVDFLRPVIELLSSFDFVPSPPPLLQPPKRTTTAGRKVRLFVRPRSPGDDRGEAASEACPRQTERGKEG